MVSDSLYVAEGKPDSEWPSGCFWSKFLLLWPCWACFSVHMTKLSRQEAQFIVSWSKKRTRYAPLRAEVLEDTDWQSEGKLEESTSLLKSSLKLPVTIYPHFSVTFILRYIEFQSRNLAGSLCLSFPLPRCQVKTHQPVPGYTQISNTVFALSLLPWCLAAFLICQPYREGLKRSERNKEKRLKKIKLNRAQDFVVN